MNLKNYLVLSDEKLCELERKYERLPTEAEIQNLSLSFDRSCLKSTIQIAKKKAALQKTAREEAYLKEKRKQAILQKFVKPE